LSHGVENFSAKDDHHVQSLSKENSKSDRRSIEKTSHRQENGAVQKKIEGLKKKIQTRLAVKLSLPRWDLCQSKSKQAKVLK
jgi:hypothetical protein